MNILDIVFPKVCVGCRREGEYICLDCQSKLARPEGICPMCCKPSLDGWTHPRCRTRNGMERLAVGLPYRGMVQQCLKKVKYKSSWEIIDFLIGLGKWEKWEGMVVPVPMYAPKERERGFNQSELIARLLAENYKGRILVMLERTMDTRPMFGLSRKERQTNIEGVFRVKNQNAKGSNCQRIILVDDVWTTGATMRECTIVLKNAGYKEVWGVTLAR